MFILETDSVDEIPLSTRKLRRRPYDPVVPVIQERRRRLPPLTSNYYLLHEREIEEDVKAIQEILNSEVPTSKPGNIFIFYNFISNDINVCIILISI